jgi:hypothetical protein
METPLASASRFLGSRPLINISNNADSAKIGEADAIRREAFYHVGRLTDAINRQNVRDEEPTRMQPNARIERPRPETEDVSIQAEPETEDVSIQAEPETEDVSIQAVDDDVPDINDVEMDRVGPNDETAEMQDDRIIDYAGEGGDGMVDDEDEDKDFVESPMQPPEPPTPEPSAFYEGERYIENKQLNRVLSGLVIGGFPKLKGGMNLNQINELSGQFLRAVSKQFPDDADIYRRVLEPIATSRMKKPEKYQLLRDTIESFARSNNLV